MKNIRNKIKSLINHRKNPNPFGFQKFTTGLRFKRTM